MAAHTVIVCAENNSSSEEPKKTKFYDDRTLSIETGTLSPEEICTALQGTMMEIRVKFGIPAYFHMAYVMTKTPNGELIPKGWCYLTVNRPEVYHLLLGRKPDGSENVDYIQDPDWVAPPEEDDVEEDDELDLPPLPDFRSMASNTGPITSWNDFPSYNMSWADIMQDEIDREQRKIDREPPMIKVFLGKLISDPKVMTKSGWYTIVSVASRVKVDMNSEEFLNIDTNKVQGFFPNSLSVKELENYFKAFSPSSDRYPEIIETKIKGPCRGPPSRLVIVKFKPQSHDALFVVQTNLRCVIRDKAGDRYIIYLSHPPAHEGK